MNSESLNAVTPEEKYENLGGIYFPILQQDRSRCMVKVASGNHRSSIAFLSYLRQHDRKQGVPA